MNEIYIRMVDLPASVKGYTICDMNGDYTIIINSRLNHEQQKEVYDHEHGHILRGDFNRSCCADLIEIFAH